MLCAGPGWAASPNYCAVYAHASADPSGAASASVDDADALQKAYDKAYYECLNSHGEPKLPADFAYRGPDPAGLGEGDISTADDENPIAGKSAVAGAPKKLASTDQARKKKWESGFDSGTPEWAKWCSETYKSFDLKTGLYNAFSGEKKPCK